MRNQKAAKQPVADKPKRKRRPKDGVTIPIEDVSMLITQALMFNLQPMFGLEEKIVEANLQGAPFEQILEDKELSAELARMTVHCLYQGALWASLYPIFKGLMKEQQTTAKGEFIPKALYGLARQAAIDAGQFQEGERIGKLDNNEFFQFFALPLAELMDSDSHQRRQKLSAKTKKEERLADTNLLGDALAYSKKLARLRANQAKIYAHLTKDFPKPDDLENEIQQKNETT